MPLITGRRGLLDIRGTSQSSETGEITELEKFELIDFKVRILDASHGTDAVTRVLIETSDGATTWTTVGVAANIIEASWMALVDSITYGLLRGDVQPR